MESNTVQEVLGLARPARVRLPAAIDRADVPAVVRHALDASRAAEVVTCDATGAPHALPSVDAIARIAHAVRRERRTFRLENASPALLALLDLCGLGDRLVIRDDGRRPP